MTMFKLERNEGPKAADPPFRYAPTNSAIYWSYPKIVFSDGQCTHEIDLRTYLLPPTPVHPQISCLADDDRYLNTLLALVDRVTMKSRNCAPSSQLVRYHALTFRHFVDWCRSQGIYSLTDFDSDAGSKLIRSFSAGGWPGALYVENRWHFAIDSVLLSTFDPSHAFHFSKRAGKNYRLETIRASFWRERIGWGGRLPVSRSIRERLEELAGAPPGRTWCERRDSEVAPPTEFSLRNTLSHINDYCKLPKSVDRPLFRISQSPNLDARRSSSKPSARTPNLSVDDAASLIRNALRVLYDLAPLLLKLLTEAAANIDLDPRGRSIESEWLTQQTSSKRFEEILGKPIHRWVNSGTYGKTEKSWSVDQVIGIVQGACAIVIAAMNARRSREVCDSLLGIRTGDLVVVDEEHSVFLASFYIEKTYCARHQFYVNRTTADAFRCLQSLKDVMAALANDGKQINHSLFACARRAYAQRTKGEHHFSFFVESSKTRSLATFLTFAYEHDRQPAITSHMFRRFFAILYYHQYDYPDLRALKQHLRHIDVAMTRVYVTDNSARPLSERIRRRIGGDRLSVATSSMRSSLDGTFDDLQSIVNAVGREKFRSTIDSIIAGKPSSGGFSKLVRSMYRRLALSATFDKEGASEDIAKRLEHGSYTMHVMQHGQCHAPEQSSRSLKGKCQHGVTLAREHASSTLCSTCPFHYSDARFLPNIRDELVRLESDLSGEPLPGMMQERANYDVRNLRALVAMLDATYSRPDENEDP